MASKHRKKAKARPRRWTEAELRKLIRSEMILNAEELAPHVLREMVDGVRREPGKLKHR